MDAFYSSLICWLFLWNWSNGFSPDLLAYELIRLMCRYTYRQLHLLSARPLTGQTLLKGSADGLGLLDLSVICRDNTSPTMLTPGTWRERLTDLRGSSQFSGDTPPLYRPVGTIWAPGRNHPTHSSRSTSNPIEPNTIERTWVCAVFLLPCSFCYAMACPLITTFIVSDVK